MPGRWAGPAAAAGRRRVGHRTLVVVLVAIVLALCACTQVISGNGSPRPLAANSTLPVVGDGGTAFDQLAKNSISDILDFWHQSYPQVSGGQPLPDLTGKLYSIDGFDVTAADKQDRCIASKPTSVVDNAFYCQLDDSIAWDRNTAHLVAVLAKTYGPFLATMVFAHEFGHAVQNRVGILGQNRTPISVETQADCAAGAFTGWALAMHAPHFRPTSASLDRAMLGYLQVRDPTPVSSDQISHGDGFDRLSAVSAGIDHGVRYCFSNSWTDRQFTERPFTSDSDYLSGGNEPLAQVLDPGPPPSGGGLAPSLNAFWSAAARSIGKPWNDVKIASAPHPKCAANASSEFGYCPNDNTVYYSDSFAKAAYYSMSALSVDRQTGDVSVVQNQPGDYALGTLFAYGWGMAVRHQLFGRSLDGKDALLAAGCYAGAYSESANTATSGFALSPPDMDEATTAVFALVDSDRAFGPRGTSALDRINSFTKGYSGSVTVC